MGKKIEPLITSKFRIGDIRHRYAEIGRLKRMEFQPMPRDSLEKALEEMKERGLVK